MADPPLPGPDIAHLHRAAFRLEWLTTLWNVLEAVVAIGSGSVAGSTPLIAFGIDSLIEVSSAVFVLWRLYKAGPDATAEETERADKRAHFLVGITFFLLAGYVAVESILTLANRSAAESSPVGIGLAVASLAVMPLLAQAKLRIGRRLQSKALQADSLETWLCAYLSATLLVGLVLNALFGIWWADPGAALAMAPFILWQGRRAITEARSLDEGTRAV